MKGPLDRLAWAMIGIRLFTAIGFSSAMYEHRFSLAPLHLAVYVFCEITYQRARQVRK